MACKEMARGVASHHREKDAMDHQRVEKSRATSMGVADGSSRETTMMSDLDMDSLVLCAAQLGLKDLANMAGVCRQFRQAAYADVIWEQHCRAQWPAQKASWGGTFQYCGGRDAFVSRYRASQQFRYSDPVDWPLHLLPSPINHILLENQCVVVAQGSNISVWRLGFPSMQPEPVQILRDHNARITCMRMLPLSSVGVFRNPMVGTNSVLVTSSSDHTIRLWGKGHPRTLRGHTGPVNTLGDRLLGRETSPAVLASGGEDGTVRLWSLSSTGGNRGRSPLVHTFYGHEHSIKELAVAGHNASVLVSASRDSKIRLWDANAKSSGAGSGGCIGSSRGPAGVPVKMECDDATCFVAAGSAVIALDLRSLRSVATLAVHEPGIVSFSRSSTSFVFATGGSDKTAKLWDLRMCEERPEPWSTLGNHRGSVNCLYVDPYKVVSAGHSDRLVYVWDVATGEEIAALDSIDLDPGSFTGGVSSMAVQGTRLVTGTCGDVPGVMRFRDFSNCINLLAEGDCVQKPQSLSISKFWEGGFGLES